MKTTSSSTIPLNDELNVHSSDAIHCETPSPQNQSPILCSHILQEEEIQSQKLPSIPPPPPLPKLLTNFTFVQEPDSHIPHSIEENQHHAPVITKPSQTYSPTLATTTTLEKHLLTPTTFQDHRLKRKLPSKLLQIATALESQPPFNRMGCSQSSEIRRFSDKENPLRYRKSSFPPPARPRVKHSRQPTEDTFDDSIQIESVKSNESNGYIARPPIRGYSIESSESTRSSQIDTRETQILENFEIQKFSKLKLSGDPYIDLFLVLKNGRLPQIFLNIRLTFLHHMHQCLYQIHLCQHKKTTSYPKEDLLHLVETELLSLGRFHHAAIISASAPMTMFCLRETFSFSKRRIKNNPFQFPEIVPGNAFNSVIFTKVMRNLHLEYEMLWRSTFRGAVPPAFI